MRRNKNFIGKIIITLEDDSKKTVYVYKNGRSITLNDGGHPLSKIVVHPSNESTEEGWIKEYQLCRPQLKIKSSEFVPTGSN